jgi:hypothetical protein
MAREGDARVKDLVEGAAAALENGQWEQALIGASHALALDDTNEAALEVASAARAVMVSSVGEGDDPARFVAVGSPLPAAVAAPAGVAVYDTTPPIPDPPPGALYYSVGPADLHPTSSYTDWFADGFVFSKSVMAAGVHLPHGATIWGWRAYVGRSAWGFRTSVSVNLEANLLESSNGFLLSAPAEADYPPGASGPRLLSRVLGAVGAGVNNRFWSYELRLKFDVSAVPPGANLAPWQLAPYFRGATVVYLP